MLRAGEAPSAFIKRDLVPAGQVAKNRADAIKADRRRSLAIPASLSAPQIVNTHVGPR